MAAISKGNMEDMLFTSGASEATVPRYVRRILLGQRPWLEWLFPLWFVKFVLRIVFRW